MNTPLRLSLLPMRLAVCRLAPTAPVPVWAMTGEFFSVSRTPDELSIVCAETKVPAGVQVEKGWRGLKVEGPLDFALIGILANLSGALAEAGISLFAISTYDTDYILVKENDLLNAIQALNKAGHQADSHV